MGFSSSFVNDLSMIFLLLVSSVASIVVDTAVGDVATFSNTNLDDFSICVCAHGVFCFF